MTLSDILLAPGKYPKCAALSAHVRRSPGVLGSYGAMLEAVRGTSAHALLAEHEATAARILSLVQQGEAHTAIVEAAIARLRGSTEVADCHLFEEKDLGAGGLPKMDHKKLLTALKNKYKLDIHHSTDVSNAVYVYIDSDDNDALRRALAEPDNVVSKNDYIILRQGTVADAQFGSFGTSQSLWIFVHAPSASNVDEAAIPKWQQIVALLEAAITPDIEGGSDDL